MIYKTRIRAVMCASLLASTLGVIAGFQLIGTSRDYDNYLYFFQAISELSSFEIFEYRFEPGFTALTYALVNANLEAAAIYTVFATLALFTKIWALKDLKNYWVALLLFLVFYLGRYFTLFEMTVLRAALAFSIGFFVFMNRSDSGYQAKDVLLLGIAITMHFSALIFIPIYIYTPKNRYQVISAALIFFIMAASIKEVALSLLPNVFVVIATYDEFNEASTLLPKPMILDIAFLAFMLYKWRFADAAMKTSVYGFSIGLAFHFSMVDYSILASRFRELLSLFLLIYVVRSMDCTSKITRVTSIGYAILSSALHLYTTHIHDPLLT